METWKRAGTGPAHWIKFSSERYYTTACAVILLKSAEEVETEKVGIGGSAAAVDLPKDGEVCERCKQKAMEQA